MGSGGALQGVRVVDLTTVLMGPFATQMLGDMGADVLKVETAEGDPGRSIGIRPHPHLSGVALNLHRGKRSLVVDVRTEGGQQVMLRLLDTAAVFVTNMRPAALRRMHLAFEDVAPGRDGLVYCEAHGYPRDTSESEQPAYDDVIQAATGIAGLFASGDTPPSLMPSVIVDKVCGMVIANAILGALYHRAQTGRGQHVEVPMFDTALAFNLVEHLDAATTRPALGRPGYGRVLNPHRRPYRTADGWVALLPYLAKEWFDLWRALGRQDILRELDGLDPAEVRAQAGQLYQKLAEVTPTRTTAEWLAFAAQVGMAASPVHSLADIVDDAALHRGVLRDAEHPVVGPYRRIASPIRMSETPGPEPRPAPLIGQHTEEVLAELGFGPDEISALAESGALGVGLGTHAAPQESPLFLAGP
jgi:crotonobetainyl-CoA:carnitine CoA-transferase CaiB-like acyl-CoA transferase